MSVMTVAKYNVSDHLTHDELKIYQSLKSKGYTEKEALSAALDGVSLDAAREAEANKNWVFWQCPSCGRSATALAGENIKCLCGKMTRAVYANEVTAEEEIDEMVRVFQENWHKADLAGLEGSRTKYAITFLLGHLLKTGRLKTDEDK